MYMLQASAYFVALWMLGLMVDKPWQRSDPGLKHIQVPKVRYCPVSRMTVEVSLPKKDNNKLAKVSKS